MFDHLLQETGDDLLQETGDWILLDTASAQYLYISDTSTGVGTSFEARMRLETFSFTEYAEQGRVGTGGFDLDEDDTTTGVVPDVPAMQSLVFNDYRSSDVRIFTGYTHTRTTTRGPHGATGRDWGVEILDLNTLADDFVLGEDESADRPAETDYERVTWLLTVGFATGAGVSAGQVPNTNTITMDAIDYRGRKPREVLDQCAEVTGKNWFIYNYVGLNKLFYDLVSNAPSSGVSLLDNVISDFVISSPTVKRSPDEVYSKVYLTWAGGVVEAENTTTRDAYRRREINVLDMGVRTNTTAQAKADAFLAASSVERITVSDLTFVADATAVNQLRAGQTVTLGLNRHNITGDYFVTRRTVKSFKGSDTQYEITLSLVDTLAPTRYLYQRGSNEVWEVKSNATQDGASVVVNRDGITITEGGITVTNEDAVVIIDGTSNMFKIAATGTVSTSSFTKTTGASSTGTVDVLTGFTYRPAFLAFFQFGGGAYPTPYYVLNHIAGGGTVLDAYESWVQVVNTDQTRVSFKIQTSRNDGTTMPVFTLAYYLLKEAAI